jgi:hypothetical protein
MFIVAGTIVWQKYFLHCAYGCKQYTYYEIIGSMNSLDSLYGESFYKQLKEYSAEAFRSSVVSNDRKKLGRLAYGSAEAMWRTKRGGTAVLTESGVRIGRLENSYLQNCGLQNQEPLKKVVPPN